MLGGHNIRVSALLSRRRSRQGGGGPRPREYAYDLAALHLELLVSMAAADEQLRAAEVDAVLAFVDQSSLAPDDRTRLQQHARELLRRPPALDLLLGRLAPLAARPALAARLVRDLARVATADAHTDPRERTMLDATCDALGVARMQLATSDEQQSRAAVRAARDRAAQLVTQRRTRAAVREALDASYRQRGA